MRIHRLLIAILALLLLNACTWVELKPEAAQVRVLTKADVADCKPAGITTVRVQPDAIIFKRDPARVKKELETLARNEALRLKGNVIVPATSVHKGEQTFDIYRCP
jgi:hypothetical protein